MEPKKQKSILDGLLVEVRVERAYQNSKWGEAFDKKNTPNDWVTYMVKYLGQAVTMPWDHSVFRTAMIKVAALALAAVEWCDRKKGKMPKRHYD